MMNYLERPYVLYALIPLTLYILLYAYLRLHQNRQELSLSNQDPEEAKASWFKRYLPFLRFIPLVFIMLSLAGPGNRMELLPDYKKGIDMFIAIDISGSMVRSKDFLPYTRLGVAKKLIQNFIKKRKNDRLGLVVFAGAAYLQSPLTNDQLSLIEIVDDMNESTIREQGTAIGDAIILSTYRLKSSQARSKVMLVITDGVSNAGNLDPKTATKVAKHFGIKVYTIGVGKSLRTAYMVDFKSLQTIAKETGGIFYRAKNPNEFQEVLDSIDALERDTIQAKPKIIIESKYYLFLYIAIAFWTCELLLRSFYARYYI